LNRGKEWPCQARMGFDYVETEIAGHGVARCAARR